jgi:hypothetical protein
VKLTKHLFVQSNGGAKRNWGKTKYVQKTKGVPSGGNDSVVTDVDTSMIDTSTALGSIVANYYTISAKSVLTGCICCCGNNYPTV